MSYLLGHALGWIGAAFILCLFAAWLLWGRRIRKLEAKLSDQKSICDFCLAESGRLREEMSRLQTEGAGGSARGSTAQPAPDINTGPGAGSRDEVDDLTRINGIGPKISARLNELGIFYYSQIAELTRDNVDWLNGQLHFKGRIDRENWVEQAKALATSKERASGRQNDAASDERLSLV